MTTDETTTPPPAGEGRGAYQAALATAERLLGRSLEPFLAPVPGEPAAGEDFKRLATTHTFGDAWSRTDGPLDTRTRALVSVTIAAVLGTLEPLRGQLRIALNNGATPEDIVEVFVQIEAYAGAARAFEGYQVALEVFREAAAARNE
ncbi:carboxymuconolactone decarboxylase family protein [Streptomyces sp. NPDC090108]|uniref:carboxymuconolactone decarboxylase family protein n=1 Tax=Streptomyces sp. NPDC090108 TaxID=3365947 RepID=UPI00380C65C3